MDFATQARAGGDAQPGGPSDDGLPAGVPGPCNTQLASAATIFCETFDAPATNANLGRTGDLDSNVWGVSRVSGDGTNIGQNDYNLWNPTLLDMCDGTTPRVNAPNDIVICDGQLREASNDNNSGVFGAGTVTVLAMSPKQPFDFADRTGTVSFDVSDDTDTHGAWPELWMSDVPVPAPFNHFDSWEALPNNGFGVRFEAATPVGDSGICQNANNLDKVRWTVGSVAVVRGYVLEDTLGYGAQTITLEQTDCGSSP